MNKALVFTNRNIKELIRDPMSLMFSIVLPLFLLVIMVQFNIPSPQFNIQNFAPGIAIFSFSFVTLFSSLLVSKDKSTSFLTRLFSSPLSSFDFIAGYTLALLPLVCVQTFLFLSTAIILGLNFSIYVVITFFVLIYVSIFFMGSGLLIGTIFNDKQAGGVTSIFIQFVVWTSGMWFDLSWLSNAFNTVSHFLPFAHMVDLSRKILAGDFLNIFLPTIVILAYTIGIYILTIFAFKKKMKN